MNYPNSLIMVTYFAMLTQNQWGIMSYIFGESCKTAKVSQVFLHRVVYIARAEALCCASNLLFGDVLIAIVIVFCEGSLCC